MSPDTARIPVRSRVKEVLLACLYYTGVLWLVAWARLRGRAVVLTYHRVLPKELVGRSFSAPSIIVTPETFDWQMQLIKRFFRPVNADAFSQLLVSGHPIPDRTCLVTFDDGWYDNLEFALPVLRRHDVPAVIFVATEYIGSGNCFWQERLARLLFDLRQNDKAAVIFDELEASAIRSLPPAGAKVAIRDLVEQLKQRPRDEVTRLLSRLADMRPANAALGEDRFLSWDEVRRISGEGLVTIGSHAMSHTPLTLIPSSAVDEELRSSSMSIRAALGKDVALLAYPNGNANEEIGAQAREAGYAAAFTTVRGLVDAGSNPHLLPRINMHEAATRSRAAFLGRIAGLP